MAADQGVGDEHRGQQEARAEGRRIEIDDRDIEHRRHHDQHHRRRDQDAERAAGGDGAGRHAYIVARADHHRSGHDAEQRDGCADGSGGDPEQRRGEDDDHVECALERRKQVAERPEQSLHESGLIADESHQNEHRHRDEFVLLHQADGLQVGEVENALAHADVTKHQRQKQQCEADRQADEDRSQHHQEHGKSEEFEARHISIFSLCSNSRPNWTWYQHFRTSETPWIMSRRAASGIVARNGHMIARHTLSCDRSPVS